MMDDNGNGDSAMTYNTVVSDSVIAEIISSQPMMAMGGEEAASILNCDEKDIHATTRKICADGTDEGEKVPKEALIICAVEKECTNDVGDTEDNVAGGGEMVAKGLNVHAEEKEGNIRAVDDEESNINVVAKEKGTPAEIAMKTQAVGDQEDALEMTREKGDEGVAHGNTLEKIAEVKQVKANMKKNVNKLKRIRKVIKAKKATPIGSRVIPKSANKQALNESLENKTDAAADGETDNEMNNRVVDNGGNGDGKMSNGEEKKLANIDTGEAKKEGDVEKAGKELTNDSEAKAVVDNGKQVQATPKNNVKQLQKAKLGGKTKEGGLAVVDATGPGNMKGQASPHKKTDRESKTMGMIFMCSSKTKRDCYHYKILGLPASRRDLVLSISEGMKLFLFDVNLKMLYGIYRAAGPGGYNIEPKAFNSAYPSQVRFAVEEDCLPLPEERFKPVIKDNYYQKNKFKGELTSDQVNGLCKLFQDGSKSTNSKRLKKNIRQPPPKSAEKDRNANFQRARAQNNLADGDRNKKRRIEIDRSEPQAAAAADQVRPKKRRRKNDRPGPRNFVGRDGARQQHLELAMPPAYVGGMPYRDSPVAYERRAYVSSVAPLNLHPPLPAPAVPPPYAYDWNADMNASRRPTLLEHRDRSFVETDWRCQEDLRHKEGIEYRRALTDYEGRLRDSESRLFGPEPLHHVELPPYYDQRYSTGPSAYYNAGRVQNDPAALARPDFGSLRSTYHRY